MSLEARIRSSIDRNRVEFKETYRDDICHVDSRIDRNRVEFKVIKKNNVISIVIV